MASEGASRVPRLFEWINRHIWAVVAVLVVGSLGVALVGEAVADTDEPNFSPSGPIYDTEARADEVFASSSSIRGASFFVEDPNGGDVLTRAAFLESLANTRALRTDPTSQTHLATVFDNDLGVEIEGVFSIAEAVNEILPGGLEAASDADVKLALSEMLADGAPSSTLRFTLSQLATAQPGEVSGRRVVVWRSPAFTAAVRFDLGSFEGADEDTRLTNSERWLRDVQGILRGEQQSIAVIGIAIDPELTGEEELNSGGPFIFLAVALIVILVAALLRSYWAGVIVTAGLAVTLLLYNGIIGFASLNKGSALLVFIVPIAMIAFGVDFFIHGSGRVREAQVGGQPRSRAYPIGMLAVFTALLLAATTSAAAFLSNIASGIEAIIEFGVGAAITLVLAYFVLGWFAPKVLVSIEERVGPSPADRGLMIGYKLVFLLVAVIAGFVVTFSALMAPVGAVALVVFIGLFMAVPVWLTPKRNARAVAKGRPMTDEVKGSGHGFKAAGSVVHFLARWRVFTLPVVAVLAILGLYGATQVKSAFELSDFFSRNTDFIKSIDKLETHFGESTGGTAYVYLEGDLTSPATLVALEGATDQIDASPAQWARDFDGELVLTPNAASLVRTAMSVPGVAENVTSATGVVITDNDGNGLPDSNEQVAAIYAAAREGGLVDAGGVVIFRADQVETFLYDEAGVQATRIEMLVTTFTDDPIILEARGVLDDAAAGLESEVGTDVPVIGVSGEVITMQDTLAAFTDAMLLALPIAIVLTVIIVSVALRSARYSLVTVIPVLLVVAWVYGYMYLAGFTINVITATIAAISVGVGIDFCTHFTVRFREEFAGEPSRFPALRRAGEGTGGALSISALTSIVGFAVMATAPTPIFASFGQLTAVMIFFAAVVSLLVLPSLLLVVTPRRKGEEREKLVVALTEGEYEYDPHARAPAPGQTGSGGDE